MRRSEAVALRRLHRIRSIFVSFRFRAAIRSLSAENHFGTLLTFTCFRLIVGQVPQGAQKLLGRKSMRKMLLATAAIVALAAYASPSFADEAAAQKWIDSEFQPSTLSKDDQLKEMNWFIKAAEPFKGMEIN